MENEVIKKILEIGLAPAILLVVVFLIIQDPDRAVKLKSLITKPFFSFFRWFSKEHIASKVSDQVNEFFKKNLYSFLVDSEKYNFKVKWVSKPDDPILKENGTLILRLNEEKDQTKNIISAVKVAIPHVVCPLIRNNISTTSIKAIDLTILQKLSYKLGKHGKAIFKKFFLDPETNQDHEIGELIRKLFRLDGHGFFVPIFLNELELVGEGIYADNDLTDYTEHTIKFIDYLLSIVNRKRGSEIELNYLNSPFNIGTILLAISQKADNEGLRPYLKRLRKELDKGCESVYIITFPPAFSFFEKFIETLESHERVFMKKIFNTYEYDPDGNMSSTKLKIALLRKNDIYVDEDFQGRIEANQIANGKKVEGIVDHVSKNESLVNVNGMRAYIHRTECSWTPIKHCKEILNTEQEYTFQVKAIDKNKSTIHLTLKFDDQNPWLLDELPKRNQIIDVDIVSIDKLKYTCIYESKLELYIPIDEISWFLLSDNLKNKYVGTTQKVKVIDVDEDNQKIFCSLRQVETDPWPIINKSIPKGKEFKAKVIDVTHSFVEVELPNGYKGRIPREFIEKAGFEYKNYQNNLVIGQGIDVVISKVFIGQKRIRLDLKRNI